MWMFPGDSRQANRATMCGCCNSFKIRISESRFCFSLVPSFLVWTDLIAAYDFFFYNGQAVPVSDGVRWCSSGSSRTYTMRSKVDGGKTTFADLLLTDKISNLYLFIGIPGARRATRRRRHDSGGWSRSRTKEGLMLCRVVMCCARTSMLTTK